MFSELIPENHIISWGGSETLNEIGIKELIKEKGYEFIDRDAGKKS